MDLKSTIQMIVWSAAEGLAALWALHVIIGLAAKENLLPPLLEIAASMCG